MRVTAIFPQDIVRWLCALQKVAPAHLSLGRSLMLLKHKAFSHLDSLWECITTFCSTFSHDSSAAMWLLPCCGAARRCAVGAVSPTETAHLGVTDSKTIRLKMNNRIQSDNLFCSGNICCFHVSELPKVFLVLTQLASHSWVSASPFDCSKCQLHRLLNKSHPMCGMNQGRKKYSELELNKKVLIPQCS